MSGPVPAGKPTSRRTGLLGKAGWAPATVQGASPVASTAASAQATAVRRDFDAWFFMCLVSCIVGIERDRKSTRLNSSHLVISYAVFCLKKKKKKNQKLHINDTRIHTHTYSNH